MKKTLILLLITLTACTTYKKLAEPDNKTKRMYHHIQRVNMRQRLKLKKLYQQKMMFIKSNQYE